MVPDEIPDKSVFCQIVKPVVVSVSPRVWNGVWFGVDIRHFIILWMTLLTLAFCSLFFANVGHS